VRRREGEDEGKLDLMDQAGFPAKPAVCRTAITKAPACALSASPWPEREEHPNSPAVPHPCRLEVQALNFYICLATCPSIGII
jgi:hypothetical protein